MIQTEFNYDRPHNPPSNFTATSIAAAGSITKERANSDKAKILAFVQQAGGATRDEIEVGLAMQGNTVRPRVVELIRAGRLFETTEQRRTRAGRMAAVVGAR